MSGFCAILGAPQPVGGDAAARRVLRGIQARGRDRCDSWSGDSGFIAVCRAGWELGADHAGEVLVLEQEPLVVAADASLYHQDDLRRALRQAGVRNPGGSPSHLIAAAYRAWSQEGLAALEGDFAFVLWDRREGRLLAARDIAGSRPLYYGLVGEQLIVASSLTAIAEHPAFSRELNRTVLAEALISASSTVVHETPFGGISRLPAGHRLEWRPRGPARVERFWEPPFFDQEDRGDAADAADQLRALLRCATRERMAHAGPTSVWMSGGYDSPAIFAVAQQAGRGLAVPVSMSYPENDPGREDELIKAIAAALSTEVRWVSIDDVPGWGDPAAWARGRDEPNAHPYEPWNRELARGTRSAGSRIALTGNGGDQFFSVSPVFLADLFRSGRWLTLLREGRAIGLRARHLREWFHWSVQPALPQSLYSLATWLRRGVPLRPHLQARLPDWLRTSDVPGTALRSRQWGYDRRRHGETFGSAEAAWYLESGFGQRIISTAAGFGLAEGVELRSPMYDRRVIEFMARRPREDRFAAGENKRLLRRAFAGLLPAEHLAPRFSRTGLPGNYLRRQLAASLPGWLAAVEPDLRLADLGLVEPRLVRATLERFLANPKWETGSGMEVFDVLMSEYWIRAHADPSPAAAALVA